MAWYHTAVNVIRNEANAVAIAGPSRLALRPQCRCLSTSTPLSSGHNRWSKIRHKKGAADQQRAALFSRLSRDIITAMRPPASSDPTLNSRLAQALQRAKEGGLTKAGIETAMARAKSAADGSGQSVTYEAVAPGGKVAMIIECLTSNSSRTVKRVKEILSKNGARTSPVAFMFERKGLITLAPKSKAEIDAVAGGVQDQASFDHLFELAVEAGADDVTEVEGDEGLEYEVSTPPTQLSALTNILTATNLPYNLQSSDLVFVPNDPLPLLGAAEESGEGVPEDQAEGVWKLVDALEEEADVVKVWTNIAED